MRLPKNTTVSPMKPRRTAMTSPENVTDPSKSPDMNPSIHLYAWAVRPGSRIIIITTRTHPIFCNDIIMIHSDMTRLLFINSEYFKFVADLVQCPQLVLVPKEIPFRLCTSPPTPDAHETEFPPTSGAAARRRGCARPRLRCCSGRDRSAAPRASRRGRGSAPSPGRSCGRTRRTPPAPPRPRRSAAG